MFSFFTFKCCWNYRCSVTSRPPRVPVGVQLLQPVSCIHLELSGSGSGGGGRVAGCQCRRPSGQTSCPVPSATMSSTAAATSPSAWAAPTPCARRACTSCTARPAPSIRRPSALTSTCCPSTAPCCSWSARRWSRLYSFCSSDWLWGCHGSVCLCLFVSARSQMFSLWVWTASQMLSTMRSAGCAWKSWLSTWNPSAARKVPSLCARIMMAHLDICWRELSSSYSVCGGCSLRNLAFRVSSQILTLGKKQDRKTLHRIECRGYLCMNETFLLMFFIVGTVHHY